MINQKGQSLIELLIAMTVFVLVVSSIAFLILDSYSTNRVGEEKTIATFLAEEGLEAARSIRNTNWDDLTDGSHGVVVSADSWIFQGTENDVSNQLREGIRKVIINTLDENRKEVHSQVIWKFSEDRQQEVSLVSYLTNWQKEIEGECGGTALPCSDFLDQPSCEGQQDCAWAEGVCTGAATPCEEIFNEEDCTNQEDCYWGSPPPPDECWGTGGNCDSLCLYYSQGNSTDYYQDPDCSEDCPPAGNFYVDPSGPCSNDGTGSCYKVLSSSTEATICNQGDSCEEGCMGTCTPCEEIHWRECKDQSGCSISMTFPPRCTGTCDPCDTFPDNSSCEEQQGCSWDISKWYWELSVFVDGSALTSCTWYSQ